MLRAISAYAFNVISQQSTLSERHAFRAGWHREREGGGGRCILHIRGVRLTKNSRKYPKKVVINIRCQSWKVCYTSVFLRNETSVACLLEMVRFPMQVLCSYNNSSYWARLSKNT